MVSSYSKGSRNQSSIQGKEVDPLVTARDPEMRDLSRREADPHSIVCISSPPSHTRNSARTFVLNGR